MESGYLKVWHVLVLLYLIIAYARPLLLKRSLLLCVFLFFAVGGG